jgi:hypothetical protein
MITTTLYNNLKEIVQEVTGAKPLTHTLRIEDNKFSEGMRFGVLPRGSKESKGVTNNLTSDYVFSIILTQTYITSNITDEDIIQKVLTLTSQFELIFKNVFTSKMKAPDIVIALNDFDISEALLLEKEKTIIVEGNLSVKSYFNMR